MRINSSSGVSSPSRAGFSNRVERKTVNRVSSRLNAYRLEISQKALDFLKTLTGKPAIYNTDVLTYDKDLSFKYK